MKLSLPSLFIGATLSSMANSLASRNLSLTQVPTMVKIDDKSMR